MKRRVVGVDFDADCDCDSDSALAAHLPHAAFPFQAAAATATAAAPPRSSLLARDLARKWSCSLNTEIPTTGTHTYT